VIFSTFITLVLVPSGYMILEDLRGLTRRRRGRRSHPVHGASSATTPS
jgi:hypothetical protein